MAILTQLINARQAREKRFAVLIDPDVGLSEGFVDRCVAAGIDYFFIGGSLLTTASPVRLARQIKQRCGVPVVIFPGGIGQITPEADAILLLSLISGRNPELLIGKHVEAAPALRSSGLEIIPTGYMLIDGGLPTTASYISNTQPIPSNKPEIAGVTALAGELLGLSTIFLDCGSGAESPVPARMIARVREEVSLPLIVGGGINSPDKAFEVASAGADLLVVGTAFESAYRTGKGDPSLLPQMVAATRAPSSSPTIIS